MLLSPGARLGVHEIVSAIGAGGMGEVYRARDTRLDRDVAIKILPAEHACDGLRPSEFRRRGHRPRVLDALNLSAFHTL